MRPWARGAAATAVLLAAACVTGSVSPSASPSASPLTPTPSPTPRVSAAPTVEGLQPLQGPPLKDMVAVATSAIVPSPPPPATPTPTPDPAVWRFEGRVTDDDGEGLAGVCVVIGPLGCHQFGPRTDDRGVYSIDLPQKGNVLYELRFELSGFIGVYYQARPTAPTVFNVVLRRR